MAEVLGVTMDGALKTQIMYKANLSFAQLNDYLSLLLELGLLKMNKKNKRTIYKTTRKGFEFLKSYDEIIALLNEEKNVKKNPLIYSTKSVW
ncbi:hypothetical protein GWO13_03935 [Candidatus Bathyarchaeota archaeon]|nr:hypothetical protein [Candidatus Bathyarchaeota archaeon]